MSGLSVFLPPLLLPADLYVHQAACYGHPVFLATSVEVLHAHSAFLVCVWLRVNSENNPHAANLLLFFYLEVGRTSLRV